VQDSYQDNDRQLAATASFIASPGKPIPAERLKRNAATSFPSMKQRRGLRVPKILLLSSAILSIAALGAFWGLFTSEFTERLLIREPVVFVWQTTPKSLPPLFDETEEAFVIRGAEFTLYGEIGKHPSGSFELHATLNIRNWEGLAGLLWDAQTSRKNRRGVRVCYGVIFNRHRVGVPSEIRVLEYVFTLEHGTDWVHYDTNPIKTFTAPTPDDPEATLCLHVKPDSLIVEFGVTKFPVLEAPPNETWTGTNRGRLLLAAKGDYVTVSSASCTTID
jgi:hypothetical protein